MTASATAYGEVYVYAMSRPGFILQHVVDASVVQTASADSKPISVVFGLVGLYLRVEKEFSGREVQRAHTTLARRRRDWPPPFLPENRGSITVEDVLATEAGLKRDTAIDDWCRCVWNAFSGNRDLVIALAQELRIG
jgi:hypothetical protein